jgi:xylan 1,4-beta-xylosidase
MRKLIVPLILFITALQAPAQSPVSIQVDLNKSLGPYKPIYSWFGYDEANFTTMKDGRRLLSELHDLSPVPVYIRVHHLLTSGNGVPELKWSSTNVFSLDAQGKPVYNFAILDGIFDAFKQAGVRPMVELGFMPKDLTSGADPYQVHYPQNTTAGSSNAPPKDYVVWEELVRKVTEHLIQRYGKEETLKWYWEVWNEPDISYWHGTPEEYFKLYDYSVAGVRAALPGALVGGPATTGANSPHAAKFLDDFLKHCAEDHSAADGKPIPLDFISYHPKGKPTIIDGHVRMGLGSELINTSEGFRIVAKYPQFIHLPIILSEADPEGCAACSAKVNPANAYRNGPLYPAYTAAALKAMFELQDRYKVNLISMLSWSFEFEDREYFEGFRTLSTNGIDKPVLNVFRMAALMSGDRVATSSIAAVPLDDIIKSGIRQSSDIDALATRGDRQAAVLLWNYHDDDAPADASEVTVRVNGLPAGQKKVLLTHYRIDDRHSNAYTVWKEMGSPQAPTSEQYARLKASGGLELLESPRWVDVDAGTIVIHTSLPRQGTSLLHVTW